MNTSALLARGFGLHWPEEDRDPARRCALCGASISTGVPLRRLIRPTTADIADTFRHGRKHVCGDCAACFAEPRLLTGSIFATPDRGLKPTVSSQPDRPRWCDLLRAVEFGTENVSVITSNTKRRLWPRAVVSVFGPAWQPLFVDGDTDRLLLVDCTALLDCLDLVTVAYSAGFSKSAIATTLLHSFSTGQSPAQVMELESHLRRWRGTDEFLLALFVAQKESV